MICRSGVSKRKGNRVYLFFVSLLLLKTKEEQRKAVLTWDDVTIYTIRGSTSTDIVSSPALVSNHLSFIKLVCDSEFVHPVTNEAPPAARSLHSRRKLVKFE